MDVYFDPAGPVETIHVLQAQMNDNQDQLKVLTPGGGAYMNEGMFDNPDWKEDYYGANYGRLLEIKRSGRRPLPRHLSAIIRPQLSAMSLPGGRIDNFDHSGNALLDRNGSLLDPKSFSAEVAKVRLNPAVACK